MQHLEVSSAVRPLKWSLSVKWLTRILPKAHSHTSLKMQL